MAKITVNQLRKIIKEELENMMGSGDDDSAPKDIKKIDMSTLERLCPKAAEAIHMSDLGEAVEHSDMFWVITQKPEMISSDEYSEEWTQTNEPELAATLSDDWDSIACDVKGKKVVFLCGSYDDEYGYYYDNAGEEWVSYNY